MASIYKALGTQDIVSTKTLLHEAIPITGSIISGSYADLNIKDFSHGMFQSIYDYPFLSSSANHIFDITFGYSSESTMSSSVTSQQAKKNNVYNQMAQVLMGYDKDGNIQRFDEDGDLTGGTKLDDCIFLTFSRLLVKDELKKETFSLELALSASHTGSTIRDKTAIITDYGALTNYRVNSPVGEYGILYISNSVGGVNSSGNAFAGGAALASGEGATDNKCGLIFYQAGVVVLTSSVFMGGAGGLLSASCDYAVGGLTFDEAFKTTEISSSANEFRRRIVDLSFNNTIELNSTIHFCRVNHNEFNYSSNPTYLSGSEVRVIQDESRDQAISYITTVGLYSADNQLLAVGKLSEPLRKDPAIELTLRARLDY